MTITINPDQAGVGSPSGDTYASQSGDGFALLSGGAGADNIDGTGNPNGQVIMGDQTIIVNLTQRPGMTGILQLPSVIITGETDTGRRIEIGESEISKPDNYVINKTDGSIDVLISTSYDILSLKNVRIELGYEFVTHPSAFYHYDVGTVRIPNGTIWTTQNPDPNNAEYQQNADGSVVALPYIREGRWVAVNLASDSTAPLLTRDNDTLAGGAGDTLIGGAGNDTYNIGTSGSTVKIVEREDVNLAGDSDAYGNMGGHDKVLATTTSYVLPDNVEDLMYKGPNGTSTISLNGNSAANNIQPQTGALVNNKVWIAGQNGDDTLTGGGGDDTLLGGIGSDLLKGAAGNDRLDGEDLEIGENFNGQDTLIGGAGNDTLEGGGGDDVMLDLDASTKLTITGVFVDRLANNQTPPRQVAFEVLVNGRPSGAKAVVTTSLPGAVSQLQTLDSVNINMPAELIRSVTLKPVALPANQALGLEQGHNLKDIGLTFTSIKLGEELQTTPVDQSFGVWNMSNAYTQQMSGVSAGNAFEGLYLDIRLPGADRWATYAFNAGTVPTATQSPSLDSMTGGMGDDTYYIDSTGDIVDEQPYGVAEDIDPGTKLPIGEELIDGGRDTIISTVTIDLATPMAGRSLSGIEEVRLLEIGVSGAKDATGTARDNVLIGNSRDNTLTGGGGNDYLDGGSGSDLLIGGLGSDTFVVDTMNDTVRNEDPTAAQLAQAQASGDFSGPPIDTVISHIDLDLVRGLGTDAANPNRLLTIENLTLAGWAKEGRGNDLDNRLVGNLANNKLYGGKGNDTLYGGLQGYDTLAGEEGDDTYEVDVFDPVGGTTTVIEQENQGKDTVFVNRDATSYNGGRFTVTYQVPNHVENAVAGIRTEYGSDQQAMVFWLKGNTLANQLTGTINDDIIEGGDKNDTIYGGFGGDTITGGTGDDKLYLGWGDDIGNGISGNDLIEGEDGNDTLIGDGSDTLLGGDGEDLIKIEGPVGSTDYWVADGGAGRDTYVVTTFSDSANFGLIDSGTDTSERDKLIWNYTFTTVANTWDLSDPIWDSVEDFEFGEGAGQVDVIGTRMSNMITANSFANKLDGHLGDDTIYGAGGDDTIDGGDGSDLIDGGQGDDSLTAGGGDTLLGGDGNDTLTVSNAVAPGSIVRLDGGEGADVYIINQAAEIDYIELDDTGTNPLEHDTLFWNAAPMAGELNLLSMVGATRATIETIEIGEMAGDLALIANSADNILTLNGGANLVDAGEGHDDVAGGDGNDTMFGGLGNDVLYGGTGADHLEGNEGDDTLFATIDLPGNAADSDLLDGGDGNDSLIGDFGADTLVGGAGDDTIAVRSDATTIIELAGAEQGRDLLAVDYAPIAAIDLNASKFANIESVWLYGSALAASVIGSDADNTITGNNSANVLTGGAGNDLLDGGGGDDTLDSGTGVDTLSGGLGNDTYVLRTSTYTVLETGGTGRGIDTLEVRHYVNTLDLNASTGLQSIEKVVFGTNEGTGNVIGNSLDNDIRGSATGNQINGGAGNDTLYGLGGGDVLNGGTGIDQLFGGDGFDTLIGGQEADVLKGEVGNDVYQLYSSVNLVREDSVTGAGIDTVEFYYDLASVNLKTDAAWANVENVRLMTHGLATSLTGSDADNKLEGNNLANVINGGLGNDSILGGGGNDSLDGGAGGDTLEGGAGDDTLIGQANETDSLKGGIGGDTYILGGVTSTVVEDDTLQSGTDTVDIRYSSLNNFDMSVATAPFFDWRNIENVTLANSTTANVGSLTGNALNNRFEGNGLANKISGGVGNDTLLGGAGNDTLGGGDNDDLLQGGNDIDTLDGGNGNDTLDGGAGGDNMQGGAGNDIFYIDTTGDVVSDSAGTLDTIVINSNAWLTSGYTLGNSAIEKVVLSTAAGATKLTGRTGIADWLMGNDANNNILGAVATTTNNGNDTLDGGAGNDTLTGGAGSDYLYGGTGNDSLVAGAGANYLDGGAGNDVLSSGTGNDTVIWGKGMGTDSWSDTGGTDLLTVNGLTQFDLWFTKVSGTSNLLVQSLSGSGDSVTIKGFFSGTTPGNYTRSTTSKVETLRLGAAGADLTDTQIANLVIAMATMSTTKPTSAMTSTNVNSTVWDAVTTNWA